MKYIILILILFFSNLSIANEAFFQQSDKQKYIAVAAVATYAGYKILQEVGIKDKTTAYILSGMIVFNIGLVKESFVDKEFNNEDMAANTIGIMLPVLFF